MMTTTLACEFVTTRPNHSDDRVTVHHGTPEPLTVCGFHAQDCWLPVVLRTSTLVLTADNGETFRPGEEGVVTLPWSEACMHLGVAGEQMRVRVSGTGVQLLHPDGEVFSSPITHGEAGLR